MRAVNCLDSGTKKYQKLNTKVQILLWRTTCQLHCIQKSLRARIRVRRARNRHYIKNQTNHNSPILSARVVIEMHLSQAASLRPSPSQPLFFFQALKIDAELCASARWASNWKSSYSYWTSLANFCLSYWQQRCLPINTPKQFLRDEMISTVAPDNILRKEPCVAHFSVLCFTALFCHGDHMATFLFYKDFVLSSEYPPTVFNGSQITILVNGQSWKSCSNRNPTLSQLQAMTRLSYSASEKTAIWENNHKKKISIFI